MVVIANHSAGEEKSTPSVTERGMRTIYTRDTDFHRFPGIEVLASLQAA